MVEKPTVSVIIPTYNRAYLIGRAIKSVLNQTYQDFELIIVDDRSTDNTEDIIRQFQEKDKRIKYIKHDKNKGTSAAKNTGIKNSLGYFLSFLDSDDQWMKNKLEQDINILKGNKNYIICSTGFNFIDEKNGKVIGSSTIKKQIISQRIALRGECITTNDFTVIKEMAIKIGGFDARLPSREDWDFWIRITSLGLGFQDSLNIVNKYTMRSDQLSSGLRYKLQGTEILFKKHKKLFLLDSIAHKRILRTLGLMNLLNGSNIDAIKYFRESYKYTKKWIKKAKLAIIIVVIKIFGGSGSKAIAFYYKFKNPNSYLLW